MPLPLLQTKLYIPPPRAQLVARPAMTSKLQASVTFPLTLVAAPAGFGKTTLVSEWITQTDQPVAWLSLDEEDNEPGRFLMYLVVALRSIHAHIGESTLASLQAPQLPAMTAILTPLLNELSQLVDPFVLVLDDYHLVTAPPIHEAVTFLIDYLPPSLRLVITTRIDPPLPLARWRVRYQLAEVRAEDLRFDQAEAATFLNEVMGLRLSEEEIVTLETRTEGWIAGLQLAALSMQGRRDVAGFIQAFTGSHIYIVDYLAEEVLQGQPADVQHFLFQTSILQRLCGALCDVLTGQAGSQTLLETLQQRNLFITPLDDERRWFRYHHLFAEVLRARLRHEFPDQIKELHHRASTWYGQQGLWDEAVQHALAADAFEQAADLIEQMGLMMLSLGSIQHSLTKWLALLPIEFGRTRPKLSLIHAWLLLHHWEPEAALDRLDDAEAALSQPGNDGIETQNIRGEIIATRQLITTLSGHFDPAQMNTWGQEALGYLHPDNASYRGVVFGTLGTLAMHQGDLLQAEHGFAEMAGLGRAVGDLFVALAATGHQANMQRARGALGLAIVTCEQAIEWMRRHDAASSPLIGGVYAILADLLRERNDLDAALHYATKAIERTTQGANLFLIVSSYLALARIKQAQGHLDAAFALIHQVRQQVEQHQFPWVLTVLPAMETQLHLMQGDLPAALSWSPDQDWQTKLVHNSHAFIYAYEYGKITEAQVLLARGRTAADQSLLGAVVARLEQQRQVGQRAKLPWLEMKAAALQALAYHTLGDLSAALASLDHALILARLEGYIRIFVDEGEPMRLLLVDGRTKLRERALVAYIDKLLAAFATPAEQQDDRAAAQSATPSPIVNLVEPLTERELEILQLVADGLSNSQLAETLIVTVGTVKKHLNNIYGKLGVASRTQAIARGRELKLLAD